MIFSSSAHRLLHAAADVQALPCLQVVRQSRQINDPVLNHLPKDGRTSSWCKNQSRTAFDSETESLPVQLARYDNQALQELLLARKLSS